MHRLRNILAKLPKQRGLHDRIRAAYWTALDEGNRQLRPRPRYARWSASCSATPVRGGLPGLSLAWAVRPFPAFLRRDLRSGQCHAGSFWRELGYSARNPY